MSSRKTWLMERFSEVKWKSYKKNNKIEYACSENNSLVWRVEISMSASPGTRLSCCKLNAQSSSTAQKKKMEKLMWRADMKFNRKKEACRWNNLDDRYRNCLLSCFFPASDPSAAIVEVKWSTPRGPTGTAGASGQCAAEKTHYERQSDLILSVFACCTITIYSRSS